MKKYPQDGDFLKKVRADLDLNMEQIDTDTLLQLHRIRHAALSASKKPFFIFLDRFYSPAVGLLAMACVIIMCVFFSFRSPEMPNVNRVADLEILASRDNLELYEQLDFYSWVAKESRHAG